MCLVTAVLTAEKTTKTVIAKPKPHHGAHLKMYFQAKVNEYENVIFKIRDALMTMQVHGH
ncbi:hypothetical protein M378DRAFT_174377, partial [Amanita muscaria Koide BX008]